MLREAEKLVEAGVRELLVISQDTSAYGVDRKHDLSPWKGQRRTQELLQALTDELMRKLADLGGVTYNH